jgi:hypothetical protein
MYVCRLSDNVVNRVSQAFSEVLKGMIDKDIVYSYIAKMADNLHNVNLNTLLSHLIIVNKRLHYFEGTEQVLGGLRNEVR